MTNLLDMISKIWKKSGFMQRFGAHTKVSENFFSTLLTFKKKIMVDKAITSALFQLTYYSNLWYNGYIYANIKSWP